MTASELAFLGLGVILGAATGAALVTLLGTRGPRREIRVTVTRDALPRRSETLSQDAFVTRRPEPAPGGPADRRTIDRPGNDAARVGIPIEPDLGGWIPERPVPWVPAPGRIALEDRTTVPFADRSAAATAAAAPASTAPASTATALEGRRRFGPVTPATALERILRGDHHAMVEVLDRIAGEDARRRHEWESLLGGLVEGMADVAVRESVIDFPLGTPFWDTFTVEQCRHIVTALASMGYRYDGRSGWVDGRVPGYRDLSQALADIGVNPIRIRAWPNQLEIASLFVGARPAAEELLPAAGPDYTAEDVRELLGERGPDLANLWLGWDAIRPALLADESPGGGEDAGSAVPPASARSQPAA